MGQQDWLFPQTASPLMGEPVEFSRAFLRWHWEY